MNNVLSGGHEQGILIGWPLALSTAPSQSPVPVGLTPDSKPNWGVSASTCAKVNPSAPPDSVSVGAGAEADEAELGGGEEAEEGGGAADEADDGGADAGGAVPSSSAACCAANVVDETGHPTPTPLKF